MTRQLRPAPAVAVPLVLTAASRAVTTLASSSDRTRSAHFGAGRGTISGARRMRATLALPSKRATRPSAYRCSWSSPRPASILFSMASTTSAPARSREPIYVDSARTISSLLNRADRRDDRHTLLRPAPRASHMKRSAKASPSPFQPRRSSGHPRMTLSTPSTRIARDAIPKKISRLLHCGQELLEF